MNDTVWRGAPAICGAWLGQRTISIMTKQSNARFGDGKHCMTPLFVNTGANCKCGGALLVTGSTGRALQ
ncbi:hypothetical protein K883_04692 [Mycobacterium sp. TKK-01-0059]|nr:hypothetical protein K883_04692 [Mycobacterium sp. TKK-01-0059]